MTPPFYTQMQTSSRRRFVSKRPFVKVTTRREFVSLRISQCVRSHFKSTLDLWEFDRLPMMLVGVTHEPSSEIHSSVYRRFNHGCGPEALGRGVTVGAELWSWDRYVSMIQAWLGAARPDAAIRVINKGCSGHTVRDLASR